MIAEKAGALNLPNIVCQNNVMKRKLACNGHGFVQAG
jgi:hypothetical protein